MMPTFAVVHLENSSHNNTRCLRVQVKYFFGLAKHKAEKSDNIVLLAGYSYPLLALLDLNSIVVH